MAQILKVTENGDIEVRHFGTIDKTPKKAKYKPTREILKFRHF